MKRTLKKILTGYLSFRKRYASGKKSIMHQLAKQGQRPEIMFIACCDSRVDPSLILQCDPGDLFVVRNVANIVPPYECDEKHHGTSAALEFGICYLNVKHLIIFGHSQCGGINALINGDALKQNDFITNWVSLITEAKTNDSDTCAKNALTHSYENALTFPWIKERIKNNTLVIHRWFFDITSSEIFVFDIEKNNYFPLKNIKNLVMQ